MHLYICDAYTYVATHLRRLKLYIAVFTKVKVTRMIAEKEELFSALISDGLGIILFKCRDPKLYSSYS